MAALSSVNFPSSAEASPSKASSPNVSRPPYLPFRRISLPTPPSLVHRESVASVASFDSLPEDEAAVPTPSPPPSASPRNNMPGRKQRSRPGSTEVPLRPPMGKRASRSVVSFKHGIGDEQRQAKRRKVIDEFYVTEKAYVSGLELIYDHFLTPILQSLDTPSPLLDRTALTNIFSNFIDIWNLHRSLFSSLTSVLHPADAPSGTTPYPPLSPTLLSHFPYLSLYTPFITAFPTTLTSLTALMTPSDPSYSPRFAKFISTQEKDKRCGRLKLRDWLLTIIQRCPRYLLLLKDLISCTSPEDPEHPQLASAHALVSKITISLNTSLSTHAQTLALLSLQRNTAGLPFQLIAPGRTLIKRGSLYQVERSEPPREREFLLFTDCLIWLASEEAERAGRSAWWHSSANAEKNKSKDRLSPPVRPGMVRTRSKSEAELSQLKAKQATEIASRNNSRDNSRSPGESSTALPQAPRSALPAPPNKRKQSFTSSSNVPPPRPRAKRQASVGAVDGEKWVFKGRAQLVDLEVVVVPVRRPSTYDGESAVDDDEEEDNDEARKFEVLSPEGSFILYADSAREREQWVEEVRGAKGSLLGSLNVTNPNSTLTSSGSTNHVRRALMALPYRAGDERIGTLTRSPAHMDTEAEIGGKGGGKERGVKREKRGKVEHWVPAIWIPDDKTEGCMRCGRSFGWRRRRHHCRLCGRCVCAGCSERTFFISDAHGSDSKPARACNACYETVFPLLNPTSDEDEEEEPLPVPAAKDVDALAPPPTQSTLNTLTNFPSWLSMPSLPLPGIAQSGPDALMAIDSADRERETETRALRDLGLDQNDAEVRAAAGSRIRARPVSQRMKSYNELLEDFDAQEGGVGSLQPPAVLLNSDTEEMLGLDDEEEGSSTVGSSRRSSVAASLRPQSSNRVAFVPEHDLHRAVNGGKRREDTVRRKKRFSLPAVALHTQSVTAHSSPPPQEGPGGHVKLGSKMSQFGGGGARGNNKRFSLMLGSSMSNLNHGAGKSGMRPPSEFQGGLSGEDDGLGKGVAAGKLNELLSRGKH